MFKSIILRKSLSGRDSVDIGLLAESLIFYKEVHLVADMSMIRSVVSSIGLDAFENLINNNHLRLSFSPAITATSATAEFTPSEIFDYCTVLKLCRGKKEPDYEALFIESLEKGSGQRGKSRRVGSRLLPKTEFIDYEKIIPVKNGLPEIARGDLNNQVFTKAAIKSTVKHYAPEFYLHPDCDFKVLPNDKGFNFQTNIDLSDLNEKRSRVYFPDADCKLTRALIMDTILKANEDLYLSSHFQSEIITTPVISSIINLKCKDIITKVGQSLGSINLFQNVVLSEGKCIKEIINSGERSFDELILLLEKGNKFKKWLDGQKADANLIKEYYNSVTASTWVDKLPCKTIRFGIFTGSGVVLDSLFIGGVSTLIGVGLSIADTFILDNLIKGWRPNLYIDEVEKFATRK